MVSMIYSDWLIVFCKIDQLTLLNIKLINTLSTFRRYQDSRDSITYIMCRIPVRYWFVNYTSSVGCLLCATCCVKHLRNYIQFLNVSVIYRSQTDNVTLEDHQCYQTKLLLYWAMDDQDQYESLPPTSTSGHHMVAGAAAGILEHSVMYPVDCVKVLDYKLIFISSKSTRFLLDLFILLKCLFVNVR